MSATILHLKTITTIRPNFFEDGKNAAYTYTDPLLGHNMTSIDLGQLYWNRKLGEAYLANLLATEAVDSEDPAARIEHDLDLQAVHELERTKSILGSFSKHMPTAAELLLCFRVMLRCVTIASRYERGFEVHLARGLISREYDQYRLADILKGAEIPNETAVGRCLEELLRSVNIPDNPQIAVISLRNDGELNQAILLASILRNHCSDTIIILDTSGANEQFSFGEWVPLLMNSADQVSKYIDYFLPRQDYKATLRVLIESVATGFHPNLGEAANAVCFINQAKLACSPRVNVPSIEQAFSHYIKTLPVFYAAGQRTIVGRLSPAKCHWAVCKFCTINSQHIMPRGRSVFDEMYQKHFEMLVQKIKDDNIESLILMDEALHPKVLAAFAQALLSRGISIIYRARCRFTNDLTADICNLLYESGCRYLGLGLESANPRVNHLVNKHVGPPIEYDNVLQNLENAGISMHVYAILGFPTETREEIMKTRDFLIGNIQRFRYLTVSANLLYLMRGSGIAQELETFNIERIVDTGDVSLVLEFVEPERAKNQDFAELSAQRIFQAEFLPDIDDPATAEAFWHFIDQTGIFYVQKVMHTKNPFHELAEVRNTPLPCDFVEHFYKPSYLFWLESPSDDYSILCDWVTFNYAQIPCWLKDFVLLFNPALSLRVNAEELLDTDRHEQAYAAFRVLVQNGLFLQQSKRNSTNSPPDSIFRRGNIPFVREESNDRVDLVAGNA